MRTTHSQRGAALLSILVLVMAMSVAAVLATTAISRQTEMIKLSRAKSDSMWAAYSAEAFAKSGISEFASLAQDQAGLLTSNMEAPLTFPVRGGYISLTLKDGMNCFNINALGSDDEGAAKIAHESWTRLLTDLDISQYEASTLANTLSDWIDKDSQARQNGAEDSYYLTLTPPYRAANQTMDSPKELAAVLGYTPALIEALEPFTCAMPETKMMKLNINSVSPQNASLLRAIYSHELSLSAAERILIDRPDIGWENVEAFETLPDIRMIPPGARRTESITTETTIFRADGNIVVEGRSWPFSFLISTETSSQPTTLWRRIGEE